MANMETVKMRSPEGEVRDVPAEHDALVPLMVAGWRQVQPEPAAAERKGEVKADG